MSLDKVKPLKLESTDTGGDSDDQFPTSLDKNKDYVECAGLVLDDAAHTDESTVIDRLGNDLRFKDGNNPIGATLSEMLAGGGITEAQHEALDTLVHEVDETSYDEVTYASGRVQSYIVWASPAKLLKIREEQYSYISGKVSQVVTTQYDGLGAVKMTMTESYTYSGSNVTSVTRTKV